MEIVGNIRGESGTLLAGWTEAARLGDWELHRSDGDRWSVTADIRSANEFRLIHGSGFRLRLDVGWALKAASAELLTNDRDDIHGLKKVIIHGEGGPT